MSNLINLTKIKNFFLCLIIYEFKNAKKILSLIKYLIINFDFFKFLYFLFIDNKILPFKSRNFNNYLDSLRHFKKLEIDLKNITNLERKYILVETFINHPAYNLSNIIIAKYLAKIFNLNIIGIARPFDFKSRILLKNFGINKILFFKDPGFLRRVKYLYKSFIFLENKIYVNDIINLKYKKIDICMSTYDNYIRYLGIPSINKIDNSFRVMLAEAIYAVDFYENFLKKNYNICKSVQSETQFNPLNIFFKLCLKNRIEVFSRLGLSNFSLRRYTGWDQRYMNRSSISNMLFYEVFKNNKKKIIEFIMKDFKNKFKKKEIGQDDVLYGLKKNRTFYYSKDKLKKLLGFKSDKICVFFLSHLLDGNFNSGARNMFRDNFNSTIFILDKIKKIKNFNWIIKKHPNHDNFKSKFDIIKVLKNIELKNKNIRLLPDNVDNSSLVNIAKVALTLSGSVAVEYPAMGVNSIFFEKGYYSNMKFLKIIKQKNILSNKLKNLNNYQKVPNKLKDQCKVYLYIKNFLIKNNCSLLPDYIPSRKINEDEFWLKSQKRLNSFNLKKDEFYQMLRHQIKYNLRHTVNFKKIKIHKKIYNDFSLFS